MERLDKICFLPPPADTPWSGWPKESTRSEMARVDGKVVEIDLPLFWFDPPWHRLSTGAADVIATAVSRFGVLVSAMRSDLTSPDDDPSFHLPQGAEEEEESDEDRNASQDDSQTEAELPPRIVPYRPERYGLSDRDFDGAKVIDVRLAMNRDEWGRFAFSPEQIERWEATPAGEPLAGGGWVPSASFPPDVPSMEALSSKLSQLRALSAEAAVFVSIGCYRLGEEIPAVVAAGPEGVILRLDDLELSGLQIAMATRYARQLIATSASPELPLWIVPGEISPDDAVKLFALGAAGVAIDSWCNPIIEETEKQDRQSSRYSSRGPNEDAIYDLIDDELAARVERFTGLFNSVGNVPRSQRLAALDEAWAGTLGLSVVTLGGELDS